MRRHRNPIRHRPRRGVIQTIRERRRVPKSIAGVMREYQARALHSGSSSGPVVTTRKQAVAIALSEQRQKAKGSHPHRNLGKFLHPKRGT